MDNEKKSFLENLYNDYSEKLYTYAYRKTGDYDLSIDIVLDTYLVAAEKIDEVYSHPNRLGWLYITLKYKTLEACRKKYIRDEHSGKKYPVIIEPLNQQNEDLASTIDKKDVFEEVTEKDSLKEYKKFLNEREFKYITYRFEDDMSVKDIAKKMDISYTNATTLWSTIKKKLKKIFSKK